MIQVKNVVKTFDGVRALDGLTMTVPKGSIYGLVGPNGAGKSTILRHITGIYRQDEGKVLVAGEPVYENPAVKARMASIPDELYYFLSASTRDMMRFYRGFYPRFDVKRYEALKDVFTTIPEKQPIRRLSKGMQKQSAFWLALCCRPDILVLDEPVDGLDPVMRRQVWSLVLSDVAEHGTTVLVSSHNLRELEDVCEHVGILSRGKVLLQRSLTDLQDNVVKMQIVFQEPEMPKLPEDLGDKLGLALMDVAGAPAQVAIHAKAGDTVVVMGAGKAGLLCLAEAKKRVSPTGKVVCLEYSAEQCEVVRGLGIADVVLQVNGQKPLETYEAYTRALNGKLSDFTVSTVSVSDTELSTILVTDDNGMIYFFSMSTDFVKASLGAEGVEKHVPMLIGNGYYPGHAEIAFDIVRREEKLRRYFTERYCR